MMIVETELRRSPIHGKGVFLLAPVKKGGLIWRFDSRIDRVYAPAEIARLPEHAQRYLRIYGTWHGGAGLNVLCGDNGRYFNPAARCRRSPTRSPSARITPRNLAAGEEFTSDYATICDEVRRNVAQCGYENGPRQGRGPEFFPAAARTGRGA